MGTGTAGATDTSLGNSNQMQKSEEAVHSTRAIYAIVWGQSSAMMQSKIEFLEEYSDNKSIQCDCIWLYY
jgi:hypothetical protein